MADFDYLRSTIKNLSAKKLYDEAVKAYGAGAFRASIIAIWTAVALDLTAKIRLMADIEGGAAASAIKELDQAIGAEDVPKMQSFESSLLDLSSAKLELLTARERVEIERIYKDRNLCAHPNFSSIDWVYTPTPELVKAHIVSAVDSVLSQRPVAGKVQIGILGSEIGSESWPSKEVDEYVYARYFSETREIVQRNLMQVLVKGALRPPDAGELEIAVDSATFQSRCGRASLAIKSHLPNLFEQELRSVLEKREVSGTLSESQLLNAFATYASLELFWDCLPDTAATRLRSLIANRDIDVLIDSRVFDGGFPGDNACREDYSSRLSELSTDEITRIIDRNAPNEQFIDLCLGRLAKSPNFRSAESTMQILLKCMRGLGARELERMFDVIKSNDQALWASGIEWQLEAMYEGLSPLSDDLSIIWATGVKELYDQIQVDSKERTWINEALYRRLLHA
ncbi:hypothetical protein QYM46_07440 [Brevibacterium sp. K11IcPPYGO002]|uniref:hypothetical protein n=1 Tax=Brevibacterium sp. K11IcPPYGO002 TaxID=3058837 RepID=UPI003D81AC2F